MTEFPKDLTTKCPSTQPPKYSTPHSPFPMRYNIRVNVMTSRTTAITTYLLIAGLLAAASIFGAIGAYADKSPDLSRCLFADIDMQGRVLWVDATANLDRITTIEGVRDIVAKARRANITTLVVDAKPVCGLVTFRSNIAERLLEWKGVKYPDFDVLGAFVEEGHKAGLEIAASFNVLGEGHKYFNVGPAYKHPEWQSISYVVSRTLRSEDGGRLPIRVSGEPDEENGTLIHGMDFVVQPALVTGGPVAVALDSDHRVAGIIDPALLDNEPLIAPENGLLLLLDGPAQTWAGDHLKAGDLTHFEVAGRRVPITQSAAEKVAVFINPLQQEARYREISLMKEVAQKYAVDAIVFDRLRYANIYNDYSDLSRTSFEKWIGRPVHNWPEDVISFDKVPGKPLKRGRYFKPWLEFRARVIRGFVREAVTTLRAARPGIRIGAYTGSWYTEYYGVGVNWGSEKYAVRTPWASQDYNEAGYAEFLDFLCTGCYYAIPGREEALAKHKAEGGTVEAAAQLSNTAVANSIPVYAGLFVPQYDKQPDVFLRAIDMAEKRTQGVMIFDLCYIDDFKWWSVLEKAFPKPTVAPHTRQDLIGQLRTMQDATHKPLDSRGELRLPAVPWQPGGG